jgi:hypothetical protein
MLLPSKRLRRPAGGAFAAALAFACLLAASEAHAARPGAIQTGAEQVVALLQVAPGQLRRARLMRVEEPEPPAESRVASLLGQLREPSLARGVAMALLGTACLWLAGRRRARKPIQG